VPDRFAAPASSTRASLRREGMEAYD